MESRKSKKGKKKDVTLKEVVANNVYAIRLIWGISPRRVVHMALSSFVGYLSWMFYSTYFIRYVVNAIENKAPFHHIFTYIAIICCITMLMQLYVAYVRNVTMPIDDVKVYKELYGRMYKKAENVELSCYEDSEFYNKYTMALDDACNRITGIVGLLFDILAALIAGMFTYVSMFRIDKMMLLFILSPLVGNFVFGTLVNKINYRIYKESVPYNRRTEYVNRVMYLADYSKEMRLSNIYNVLKRTYDEAVDKGVQVVKSYKGKNIAFSFFQYYFSYTIIFEGVLLYGAYCALVGGTMTPGELAVLTSMMVVGSWILVGMTNNIMQCSQNGMFMHSIRTFLEYEPVIPEDYDGDEPDREVVSIEFRNVGFSYKEGEPVIRNLSFRIEEGESIALVGHNGAGKSTIVKLLFRLYDPTEGEILVNGRNIKEYNLKAYRELFAAAFQDYKILAGTVKENVLMGRTVESDSFGKAGNCGQRETDAVRAPDPIIEEGVEYAVTDEKIVESRENTHSPLKLSVPPSLKPPSSRRSHRSVSQVLEENEYKADQVVEDALKHAGVYEKVMSLKNGMDTILTKEFDEDGAVLSGGEFQKIVVARAFANPAPVKVFDEPSSALDPIAEYELFENILEDGKGHMMVFISHRLSSVKNADEVLMLENGELIERGNHAELMEKKGKYADMYLKQARNYQPDEEEMDALMDQGAQMGVLS